MKRKLTIEFKRNRKTRTIVLLVDDAVANSLYDQLVENIPVNSLQSAGGTQVGGFDDSKTGVQDAQ